MRNPYFRRRDWQPRDLAQFQRTLCATLECPRSSEAHKRAARSELQWVNAALGRRPDCQHLHDTSTRPRLPLWHPRQPA